MSAAVPLTEAGMAALAEAKARGLPDGWSVKFDSRRRRKWISPIGRVFDSLPKALAGASKLAETLDPCTNVTVGKKRPAPGASGTSSKRPHSSSSSKGARNSSNNGAPASGSTKKSTAKKLVAGHVEDDELVPPEPDSDPETSLDGVLEHRPSTVHWDPNSAEGRKVGYRIRIFDSDDPGDPWKRARLIRYDPYTNKYKLQFDDGEVRKCDAVDKENCCWLLLKDEVVQTGSRFVWAVVKGFAWWPAQVLICEPSTPANKKEGYVYVEFFLTQEVALVKDTLDFVRPFNDGHVDDAMQKNKRKRNPEAVVMAREEEAATMVARSKAIHFYAEKAFALVNKKGSDYLARDISFFRSDVNYPYGEHVKGRAQQYSTSTKKWLVVYEPSIKTKTTYDPSWVNLLTKGIDCKRLDKAKHVEITEQDLIPFIFGTTEDDQSELDNTLRCKGCTQMITNHDILECRSCRGVYHPGCLDPPMTSKMADKAVDAWVCSKCIRCKGCSKLDIGFGCKPFPLPSTLYLAPGEQLELCSMCTPMYEVDKFCANCGHIWDDVRYHKAQRAIKWLSKSKQKTKKKGKSAQGKKKKISPKNEKNTGGASSTGDSAHDEMSISTHASLDASRFYPDSNVWGFNEGSMLMCDGCSLWVHAACGSLTKEEYDETNAGVHPIYSTEFLCRVCCKRRCMTIIKFLQNHDAMMLFGMPVTEQMAPTYHDVIKNPMDLETMTRQAETGQYHNYAWLRDSFELMVLNALTFNRPNSKYWNEAKRYYKMCVEHVFSKIGKGAPPGKYTDEVQAAFAKAVRELELEKERVQQDDTVEKKDLVAGSLIKAVELAPLCTPVDPPSCVPFAEVQIKRDDAFYCAWMECCFTCGSSGATDTMLFCVDCGEAYHSFCANVPIHSMDAAAVSRWRCANCKVCEISGDVPDDETKMLYCEMCDRAFTRDLLDPPLKFVPSGLWICGSCVDCKTCNNTCDNGKISLKYWSRDPHMCFACGGCKGLVGKYTSGRKCGVCSKNLRSDEGNLVECRTCDKVIHARCDPLARLESNHQTPENEDVKNKSKNNNDCDNKYECPHCRRKEDTKVVSKNVQQNLHSQAWNFVSSGIRPPRQDMSKHEFFEVFCDEIEWRMKSMWRDEYRSLLRDGLRVLVLLDEKLDKTSYQTILSSEVHDKHFSWMRARASRFIRMAKRHKWTAENVGKPNIRSLVVLAKLASSFLHIVLPYLKKKSVRYSERLSRLLVVPHDRTGVAEMPDDIIKTSGYRHIISEGDWKSKVWDDAAHERFMQFSLERGWTDSARKTESTCNKKDNHADANGKARSTIGGRGPRNKVKPPKALIGWNKAVFSTEWKDPRTCCLCHACGDDDAGNDVNNIDNQDTTGTSPETSPEVRIQHTGRLIPFEDGLWVHSNCALWSSEVWESPKDGLIHEFDKARNRGGKLKCFGCGRPGATLGCNKQNCAYNYHFACSTAAGAVLTSTQQMFCQKHKSFASNNTDVTCYEPMKIMTFAGDRETSDRDMVNFCYRVGSLIVHSLGEIEQDHDGFHSRHYITPPGYMATRVFWSSQTAQQRTLYALKIDRSKSGTPLFSISAADDPGGVISCRTAFEAYETLIRRVLKTNHKFFSRPNDMFSLLPMVRAPGQKAFGLNAAQFFGFGLNHVRKALERLPGAAAVAVPLTNSSPMYNFCFLHPQKSAITELQRNRAAAVAEKALENSSGCARTEGTKAVHKSGGSGRITRALVKRADDDTQANSSGLKTRGLNDEVKVELESNQAKYREMKSVPIDERLAARRSHIHGWGLFTKVDIPKHGMIIEYMGETVRQCIADKRERAYELAGVGSCYMFRLDLQRIVDATKIGCMARFMNHCCRPNAYAKVITADTEEGMDKKIVVFALRSISAGQEITYDYKFPVEDGSLRCTCGAPNCIGRLN